MYVWDLDETLVLFNSLMSGKIGAAKPKTLTSDEVVAIGRDIQTVLFAFLDGVFHWKEVWVGSNCARGAITHDDDDDDDDDDDYNRSRTLRGRMWCTFRSWTRRRLIPSSSKLSEGLICSHTLHFHGAESSPLSPSLCIGRLAGW